jgi:hypothetical protein
MIVLIGEGVCELHLQGRPPVAPGHFQASGAFLVQAAVSVHDEAGQGTEGNGVDAVGKNWLRLTSLGGRGYISFRRQVER